MFGTSAARLGPAITLEATALVCRTVCGRRAVGRGMKSDRDGMRTVWTPWQQVPRTKFECFHNLLRRSPLAGAVGGCRGLASLNTGGEGTPLSQYSQEKLNAFMQTHFSARSDTKSKRDRALGHVDYMQEELGATEREAWDVLGGHSCLTLMGIPLETIHSSVEYFRAEAGVSDDHLLKFLGKYPEVFRGSDSVSLKVEQLEEGLGLSRQEAVAYIVKRPKVIAVRDLDLTLEFLLEEVGIPREVLVTRAYGVWYSLEGRMRPRWEFVCKMEAECGISFGYLPQTYWMSSESRFEKQLSNKFGEDAADAYRNFRSRRVHDHRCNISTSFESAEISDFARQQLDEFMERNYSVENDTEDWRWRVLGHVRYMEDELGAPEEEAWALLSRGKHGKNVIATPVETIRGMVDHLREEGGWSNEIIWQICKKSPTIMCMRLESAASKIEQLEEGLGVSREDAMDLVKRCPLILSFKLDKRLHFLLSTAELPRQRLLERPYIIASGSVDARLRPRWEYVTMMERKHGIALGISPASYWARTDARFEMILDKCFGQDAVVGYRRFYEASLSRRRGGGSNVLARTDEIVTP